MSSNTNETVWYQWRNDEGDVGEQTESGILFIPSIKQAYAGSYTCRGRNVACKSVVILENTRKLIYFSGQISDFFK